MHILFAGGGTAGHINPALAIAGYVKEKQPDAKISFIGTAKRLESRLVPEAGYDFYTIDVEGFQRSLSLKNIRRNLSAAYKAVKASHDARRLLERLKPDLVVGTGGYVSGPVVRQAQKLGIKTAIHEQNAYPGVTTKMLSEKADAVMLAMPEAERHLKLRAKPYITGNPVRQSVLSADRERARKALGIDERPMILSFGGSLGARAINEAAADLIAWHWKSGSLFHFHGAGSSGYKDMQRLLAEKKVVLGRAPTVRFSEYINDMDLCMAAADLVLCRAGASTISELTAIAKPSILVPSPNVTANHQEKNARVLADQGAARLLLEKDCVGDTLYTAAESLLRDKPRRDGMVRALNSMAVPDAGEKIYETLMEIVK